MINVLHIISPGSGNFGGIESFLIGYYRYMEREKIHFDFSFCGLNTMKLQMNEKILSGSTFTEYKALENCHNGIKNWITLIRKIRLQLKKEKYDVVEVHTASPLVLAFCGIALTGIKIKKKIAHSHALTGPINSRAMLLLRYACIAVIRRSYNYFFSCSYMAAEVFGKQIINSANFFKINNAIDVSLFSYKLEVRKRIRENLDIKDTTIIIGHVARLSEEKNQKFLIDVFKEIHSRYSNSKLWIIGEGNCRAQLEERASAQNLSDDIRFWGERKDVNNLLQGMDAFIITSLYEGLCISAIESQTSGLPTFVSDGVPEECRISSFFRQIPLSETPSKWATIVLENIVSFKRYDGSKGAIRNGYDTKTASEQLQNFYTN